KAGGCSTRCGATGNCLRPLSGEMLARYCARLGARPVQRCNDRLAFLADDVGGIVVIVIVRFHHVEYHRLRLIAGGAPNAGGPASTSIFLPLPRRGLARRLVAVGVRS